jgi:hypothetical protein
VLLNGSATSPARVRERLVAAACGASILACATDAAAPPYVVRDSAGVQIVESARQEWTEAGAWRVGAERLLRIGEVDGPAAFQFSGITGAVRFADGSIAVADAGSQQVRFFAPDGRFLRAVGGQGGGPGEFTGLSGLGPTAAGGVWAYDFALRRITWLDASGAIIGLTTLGPEPPVLNAVGALPDGTLVLAQLWGARQLAEATRTGTRRDPVAYVRFDADGALRDTIAVHPGREVVLTEEGGRGVMTTPLFGRNSAGAVLGDELIVGSADSFELDVYEAAGALRRRFRIPNLDLSLRPGEAAAAIEQRVAAAPAEERAAVRALFESQPKPAQRPAHAAVRADRAGNLWVAEWTPWPQLPQRWTVLASDGRWLGEVRMPPGFYPHDIGPDWIMGVERDSLDVETLVVYPLIV